MKRIEVNFFFLFSFRTLFVKSGLYGKIPGLFYIKNIYNFITAQGSNILKDENDKLKQEEHVTNTICVNWRKKFSGKQEIKAEQKNRIMRIIKALEFEKRKRLRKQQRTQQRPYEGRQYIIAIL